MRKKDLIKRIEVLEHDMDKVLRRVSLMEMIPEIKEELKEDASGVPKVVSDHLGSFMGAYLDSYTKKSSFWWPY